jgi:hypothetical protein
VTPFVPTATSSPGNAYTSILHSIQLLVHLTFAARALRARSATAAACAGSSMVMASTGATCESGGRLQLSAGRSATRIFTSAASQSCWRYATWAQHRKAASSGRHLSRVKSAPHSISSSCQFN